MAKYVIDPETQGPPSAQVDEITLDVGSEPVELTDDQVQRLTDVGVEVVQAEESQPAPAAQPTTTTPKE